MTNRLQLLFGLILGLCAPAAIAEDRAQPLPYPIVGTGQTACYDNYEEIAPPKLGEPFFGQDAQHPGTKASYKLSADGMTVYDNITGLTWQRSPSAAGRAPSSSDKLTLAQAFELPAKLNAAAFGGFNDWRLPTIKELYSLILFSGLDVSGPNLTDTSRLTPFIDAKVFKFAYGDPRAGERTIDSQWASCTLYVANPNQMFGVNFADGRIKGYGTTMPGRRDKTFYAICVRGNSNYGKNDFRDNGDGTVTDRATGLMWAKADSGKGMNWEAALAWVQKRNAEGYLGHNDWRLPNAKELESIVDYSRSPATSQSAAIDPVFNCTQIANEIGRPDYAYYWTGTTHAGMRGGEAAVYVSFGRAAGFMPPPGGPPERDSTPGGGRPNFGGGDFHFVDVHGAGAQRSDPKTGDPRNFPQGRGPQGDVIRILNYVRCVRDGKDSFIVRSPAVADGGTLPIEFTGDGASATLPLEWSGAPPGVKGFALIMHHVDPQGTPKWYWILYDIPVTVQSLPKNVKGVGTLGNNSINGRTEYAPPHSKGPGPKTYVFTVYALSAPPRLDVPPDQVSRDVLLAAIKDRILASTELRVVYTRQGDAVESGKDLQPPPPGNQPPGR